MVSIKQRYAKLEPTRQPYVDRAREAAKLTIPSLFPPEGATGHTKLPTPYQSVGSRGVNNLSSKLLLTLFPPNSPFFRFLIAKKLQIEEEVQTEIENALSKMESEVMDEIETLALRPSMSEALKQLIVAGNVLLFLEDSGLRVFHLDRYVVKRDGLGRPLEIIVKESVFPSTLDPEILAACEVASSLVEKDERLDLYTSIKRSSKNWVVSQELNDHIVPDSSGTYPLEECPWIALRFTKIDGEDYGRGYVEEYLGDLVTMEELSKAIVQGSAAAAKVIFMVDPNGTVKVRTLAKAENLDVIQGNANEVSVLQLQKFADFRIALETLDRAEKRLAHAFLLNSAIQRSGERVTAEEIRFLAGELEDALGGTYSLFSRELQMTLIKALVAQMRKAKKLPALPNDTVKLAIITGIEALGRNHDLEKLRVFLEFLQPLGPDVIQTYVNIDEYCTRVGTGLAINTKGLVKTTKEIQEAQQQDQMAQMMQQLGPTMFQQLVEVQNPQASSKA